MQTSLSITRKLKYKNIFDQLHSCSETNRIYNVEAGAIQRIAIVMGPGFYDPHLTPESIAENYTKVESIEGFSEPDPFEL